MDGDLVPCVVIDRFDPDIPDDDARRRRLCCGVKNRPVSQLRDPAVDACDRLRDRAAALPVADRRLDIRVRRNIRGHQLPDERLPRPQFVDVDPLRRDPVDDAVDRVEIFARQFGERPDVPDDRFPVAGMPRRDLRRAGRFHQFRHQRRHAVFVPFDVDVVVVSVAGADHQVADRRLDHLAVCDHEPVDVQPVRDAAFRDAGVDDRRPQLRVLHPREIDVRVRDVSVRDGRRSQHRVDRFQVGGVDFSRADGSGCDLVSRDRLRRDFFRCDSQRRDFRRLHRARGDFVRRDRVCRQVPRRDDLGIDRLGRDRARRDLFRGDGLGRDFLRGDASGQDLLRRDRIRRQQLRHDGFRRDLVRRNAPGEDLPRRDAVRLDVLAADGARRQHPPGNGSAAQFVPRNGSARALFPERAFFVPQRDRVKRVARHLDAFADPQMDVRHQRPVARRAVLQRGVFPVFLRVRQVFPVHFQRDLRPVAFVDRETVVRGFAHPRVNHVLRQLDLGSVCLLFFLSDLQACLQRFRPDERHGADRVDVFLRQQQCAAVLRLRQRINPRHDVSDVSVPADFFQIDAVGDPVPRIAFLRLQQENVQVVADHPCAGRLQETGLRIHDGVLRVLPRHVPADRLLGHVRVDPARIFLHHRALNQEQRRRGIRPRDVAFPQHGPRQLVTHMFRVDADGFFVRAFPDPRDHEILRVDVLRWICPRLRLAQVRASADFDEPHMPGQVRRLHVLCVEIAGFDQLRARVQRCRNLPAAGLLPRDLRPVIRQHGRRAGRQHAGDRRRRLVVLFVVADLVSLRVFRSVFPCRVADCFPYRHRRVQRDAALSRRNLPVADRPQRDRPDVLFRHRTADDHSVVDPDPLVVRHHDIEVIPAVVLVVDLRLVRVQRDPVPAEISRPLSVKFDHGVHLTNNGTAA